MTDPLRKPVDRELLSEAATRFTRYLNDQVVHDSRGDHETDIEVAPEGRYWLGLLAPEALVVDSKYGDRFEKMRPCAMGMRVRPAAAAPWSGTVLVRAAAWHSTIDDHWHKTEVLEEEVAFEFTSATQSPLCIPLTRLEEQIARATGAPGRRLEVRIERETGRDGGPELVIQVVNTTAKAVTESIDGNHYQVSMSLRELPTQPFYMEGLPDSFRYDRTIPAYGLNCGVDLVDGALCTNDAVIVERHRPRFWSSTEAAPDLRFETLAKDPLPQLDALVAAHRAWGADAWSTTTLEKRSQAESWTSAMAAEAAKEASTFEDEARRLAEGISLLRSDPRLLRAFQLANRAMLLSARGRYDSWRPFQVGFQLASLGSLIRNEEANVVDVLWFATGGGKTETYLGLLVMAALFDRMRGKTHGITAWSRFPLRMLSLQQTQRFANALAGAEIVRRQEGLGGEPFRVGYFVGSGNTPNKLDLEPSNDKPDWRDPNMPARFRVLMHCPFCRSDVQMAFDPERWTLEHRCLGDRLGAGEKCPWPDQGLPFHIVDDEIYRILPTLVVGTLDKAATLGMQVAMRGFVGNPVGLCSREGHGHTYTANRTYPNGCRVPQCAAKVTTLPQPAEHYRMTFRLQDELHLLRDSLGAIDAHYEDLLDGLAQELTNGKSKILASSATLAGFSHQCRTLYSRDSRVFPVQGPRTGQSFWFQDTPDLLRRFVALAPRGQTNEYAHDRILTVLQRTVRNAVANPTALAVLLDVDEDVVPNLVSLYGTQVVYGNTNRDVQASLRSLETQVHVDGPMNTQEMTGYTDFEQVRHALHRLEVPEPSFGDRIHVVCASSMISHGVDVDRLNCMLVLGQPLTTAEFIQSTARVGRTWPGIVFVLHRMARERDVGLFRSFRAFVEQGDRFVEAIPITRRSQRVLEKTVSGVTWGRMLAVLAPAVGGLARARIIGDALADGTLVAEDEIQHITDMLGIDAEQPSLAAVVREHVGRFLSEVRVPRNAGIYPQELWANKPMMSLRDVEATLPVTDES
ncbi:MAG TPA: helicase [Planctomycetota bacterium]|nr:helicase [Planctomycetota bacterium]